MERDARYRLITLGVILAMLAGVFAFLHLAHLAGESQKEWGDLPEPVRRVLRKRAGDVAVVQAFDGATPRVVTFRITLEHPDGRREQLWLAADGTSWPPAATRAADE